MANAENLNRRTFCSLVLLCHIFLSLGISREAMNMVTPAVQLASKIPDVHIQLWESAILKGKLFCNQLYEANWRLNYKYLFSGIQICIGCAAVEAEKPKFTSANANFSPLLMKGNSASHQPPEHALITWIEQPLTFFLQLGTNTTGRRENFARIRVLRVLYSSIYRWWCFKLLFLSLPGFYAKKFRQSCPPCVNGIKIDTPLISQL